MVRTTKFSSVAVIAAAGLLLAACSSGGSDTASSGSSDACEFPTLKVGSLLPQTGDLAFLGPPEFAGVDLAVQEINAAGGVLGSDIVHIVGDSGDTSTNIASQTVDSHIAAGASVIFGAASSGVSLTVIDKITSAGLLQMSPANTSPAFTTYADDNLYWRVAPSDAMQGLVLAEQAVKDGFTKAAAIARQDAYGEGLLKAFSKNFAAAGGTVTSEIVYDPTAASFEAEVAEIKAGAPEVVVVITFDEGVKLIQEMIKQGVGPQQVKVYLVDGNLSTTAFADFPAGTMTGVVGTVPSGDADLTAFNAKLDTINPNLEDYTYGAQSYDGIILLALAAEAAGCADGRSLADNLPAVAAGGEKCTTYADCLAILKNGGDVDFDGVTGPLEFNSAGDPKFGTIAINQYSSNTEFAEIGRVTGEVPTS
jgi:ABC-type branched-subunit amino acid transport system substrate-binding protein